MKFRIGSVLIILSGVIVSSLSLSVSAHDRLTKYGMVVCGGDAFLRNGDTETFNTFYSIRNPNALRTAVINRIRAFDGTGAKIFDSNTSGFPGDLASGNTIPAKGGKRFSVLNMVTPPYTRPFQFRLEYEISKQGGNKLMIGGTVTGQNASNDRLAQSKVGCRHVDELR